MCCREKIVVAHDTCSLFYLVVNGEVVYEKHRGAHAFRHHKEIVASAVPTPSRRSRLFLPFDTLRHPCYSPSAHLLHLDLPRRSQAGTPRSFAGTPRKRDHATILPIPAGITTTSDADVDGGSAAPQGSDGSVSSASALAASLSTSLDGLSHTSKATSGGHGQDKDLHDKGKKHAHPSHKALPSARGRHEGGAPQTARRLSGSDTVTPHLVGGKVGGHLVMERDVRQVPTKPPHTSSQRARAGPPRVLLTPTPCASFTELASSPA